MKKVTCKELYIYLNVNFVKSYCATSCNKEVSSVVSSLYALLSNMSQWNLKETNEIYQSILSIEIRRFMFYHGNFKYWKENVCSPLANYTLRVCFSEDDGVIFRRSKPQAENLTNSARILFLSGQNYYSPSTFYQTSIISWHWNLFLGKSFISR